MTSAPASLASATTGRQSTTRPDAPDCWTTTPTRCASSSTPAGKAPAARVAASPAPRPPDRSATTTGRPTAWARPRVTASVCGKRSASSTT
ncbi:Uncharacterised protein [Mycobacteroides abscessus]|nr:Uncharacterised protein [Mycobacteroides abscessus]